ncbi:hypothetical protein TVAG_474050 [Trichomonas vaginalis G3]|uniref:Uncharacterized protein n=1 Tax=Trichomonas vaginalis (strain ATCC PRA-98 / G3) TaxID=412133 RepID=A2EQ51_TRIV3|nr:hypothetical protein TVAGG3_0072540 [Trichomonas vaginalis G3]EAY05226.1 hypothetical protein TVAG_474050 [Trichomonas vaginalis G3]KAI5542607.1 hypothetical protein TVAGG3_0072540 [Trichomonas vaginalis G3]|eukprot:XP_001317449.1 hypothetical protein [Trichomonas vaginalis G3]
MKSSAPSKSKPEEYSFDNDLPDPMSKSFLNRSLIDPWRRTDKMDCTETQLPANQIWTQLQQQMFELQDIARHRGVPNTTEPIFTSPYPQ